MPSPSPCPSASAAASASPPTLNPVRKPNRNQVGSRLQKAKEEAQVPKAAEEEDSLYAGVGDFEFDVSPPVPDPGTACRGLSTPPHTVCPHRRRPSRSRHYWAPPSPSSSSCSPTCDPAPRRGGGCMTRDDRSALLALDVAPVATSAAHTPAHTPAGMGLRCLPKRARGAATRNMPALWHADTTLIGVRSFLS